MYCSGNPFRPNSTWKALSTTPEDLTKLIQSLGTPASPSRKAAKPGPAQDNSNAEASLKRVLMRKVTNSLKAGEERLAALAAKREEIQKAREREQQKAIKAARAAIPQPPRSSLGKRSTAHRVDYHAIENGTNVWRGQVADGASELRPILQTLRNFAILLTLLCSTGSDNRRSKRSRKDEASWVADADDVFVLQRNVPARQALIGIS